MHLSFFSLWNAYNKINTDTEKDIVSDLSQIFFDDSTNLKAEVFWGLDWGHVPQNYGHHYFVRALFKFTKMKFDQRHFIPSVFMINVHENIINSIRADTGNEDFFTFFRNNMILLPVIDEKGEIRDFWGLPEKFKDKCSVFFNTNEKTLSSKHFQKSILSSEFSSVLKNYKNWIICDGDFLKPRLPRTKIIECELEHKMKHDLRMISSLHVSLPSNRCVTEYIDAGRLASVDGLYLKEKIAYEFVRRLGNERIQIVVTTDRYPVNAIAEKFSEIYEKQTNYTRPRIISAAGYERMGFSSDSSFSSQNVLIIFDVIGTGTTASELNTILTKRGANVIGVATVFDSRAEKKEFIAKLIRLVEYPIKLYSADDCPQCMKNDPPLEIDSQTRTPIKRSHRDIDILSLIKPIPKNKKLWQWVLESNALYMHTRTEAGKHYHYYINTELIIKQRKDYFIREIKKHIIDIENLINREGVNENLINAIIYPQDTKFLQELIFEVQKEFMNDGVKINVYACQPDKSTYKIKDYEWNFSRKVENMGLKNILIVDDGANTGNTIVGIHRLIKKTFGDNCSVYCLVFIDRLINGDRNSIQLNFKDNMIHSIFKVNIPSYIYDSQKCNFCQELERTIYHRKREYGLSQSYIEDRKQKIGIKQIKEYVSNENYKVSDRTFKRVQMLDALFSHDELYWIDLISSIENFNDIEPIIEAFPYPIWTKDDRSKWLLTQFMNATDARTVTKILRIFIANDNILDISDKKYIEKALISLFSEKEKNKVNKRMDFAAFFVRLLLEKGELKYEDFASILSNVREKINEKYRYRLSIIEKDLIEVVPDWVRNRPSLNEVYQQAIAAANSDSTVLIIGPTGVGKGVLAEWIHKDSSRAGKRFSEINCNEFPQELIAAELFGHERGAFTGASLRRIGLLESADGGIVFIDEIHSMPLNVQLQLLRVLEKRPDLQTGKRISVIRRIGSNELIPIDVRIIAAGQEELFDKIISGEFRRDVYYRLNVLTIKIHALKEARGDIPYLVNHFIAELSARSENKPSVDNDAMEVLENQPWPGNVRELRNIIERCLVRKPKKIDKKMILDILSSDVLSQYTSPEPSGTLRELIKMYEKELIMKALQRANGVQATAAKELGIDSGRISKLIRIHKIKSTRSMISSY